MNSRFSIAVHIMTLLCTNDILSSETIAESVNVNPVIIRKELSNLIKMNLVQSKEGKNGGYMLARSPEKIGMEEIYSAVAPKSILGKAKNEPDPTCRIGKQINGNLESLRLEVEQAVINRLNQIKLKDFYKNFD